MHRTSRALRIAGGVAIVFGVLTVISGATTLWGAVEMGAVVPFVLWFNTFAGLAYVAAGLGLWLRQQWAIPLSLGIFAATLLVFAGFGAHVVRGGDFETRTVFAMALRTAIWGAIALFARRAMAVR